MDKSGHIEGDTGNVCAPRIWRRRGLAWRKPLPGDKDKGCNAQKTAYDYAGITSHYEGLNKDVRISRFRLRIRAEKTVRSFPDMSDNSFPAANNVIVAIGRGNRHTLKVSSPLSGAA